MGVFVVWGFCQFLFLFFFFLSPSTGRMGLKWLLTTCTFVLSKQDVALYATDERSPRLKNSTQTTLPISTLASRPS